MNRIDRCFQQLKQDNRAALIPYLTAGDPCAKDTLQLLHALVEAGADIIELGVPFSDPMADGPTIQLACERALDSGMSLRGALDIVSEFRKTNQHTPIVLMGYLNPVEAMGAVAFVERAKAAGVDGVLSVDLAVEEADSLAPALRSGGLAPVFLVAPTTSDERVAKMGQEGQGYLYYVSLKGVTGSQQLDVTQVNARVEQLKALTGLPIAVGFGIRTPENAKAVAKVADAVIVGSALVEIIAAEHDDTAQLCKDVADAAAALADAVHGAREL
ncbi:MAG: tryptophan synthase subunit alpha [Oceanococcus sp.]